MLGFFLAFGLLLLLSGLALFLILAIISVKYSEEKVTVKEGTILRLELTEPITERKRTPKLGDLQTLFDKDHRQLGLYDIQSTIFSAALDKNISGMYIHLHGVQGGRAALDEIRTALEYFKAKDKFIIAYGEEYSPNDFYLASVADQVYLNPLGQLEWRGYASQTPFFKGTLDKLEIKPEIIRHGKFKSAIEPFIADHMSEENRAQIKALLDYLWNEAKEKVSVSRQITTNDLELIAKEGRLENADDAVKYGMVTGLLYEDEVLDLLKHKTKTKDKDPSFIGLSRYYQSIPFSKPQKSQIAVIYAVGSIVGGHSQGGNIGSESLCQVIKEASEDNDVKAIVLRVDSPGGSALASDVIWRQITLAKKDKPVVASFGNVAASGGYYISCGADKIVSGSGTITGSIGVFGLLFNLHDFYQNKLGITIDTYKTGPFADTGRMNRALTDLERKKIQNEIEFIYETFIRRVANGRNLSMAQVDEIGQGRVWTGSDALRLGLVDKLGDLDDAINLAASLAKVSQYDIITLPNKKERFEEILDNLSAGLKLELRSSSLFSFINQDLINLEDQVKQQGIQARLPFDLNY